MALQIEKPGTNREYILNADRASSAPTKFQLCTLSWKERNEIGELAPLRFDQAVKIAAITQEARAENRELSPEEIERIDAIAPMDAKSAGRMLHQHALAVRYGVTSIDGLLDGDGMPLKMSGADFSQHAPDEVLHELGAEIIRISAYSEVAIKK